VFVVGHLLSSFQFSECLAAHPAAAFSIANPLITSVSPSGHIISTTQSNPGLPHAEGGPMFGHPTNMRLRRPGSSQSSCHIKLTHYPVMYRQLAEQSDDPVIKHEMLE
jgi:hypothetical protein